MILSGSGTVIDNIEIIGGQYGANIGNQQYTTRNLTISDSEVCISQIWNWGWTYQGLHLRNCGTAISMVNGGPGSQTVGSVIVTDSQIKDCRVFVDTVWEESIFVVVYLRKLFQFSHAIALAFACGFEMGLHPLLSWEEPKADRALLIIGKIICHVA